MAEENSHLRKQLEGGAHESTEVRRAFLFFSGEREEGEGGGLFYPFCGNLVS